MGDSQLHISHFFEVGALAMATQKRQKGKQAREPEAPDTPLVHLWKEYVAKAVNRMITKEYGEVQELIAEKETLEDMFGDKEKIAQQKEEDKEALKEIDEEFKEEIKGKKEDLAQVEDKAEKEEIKQQIK